jgi:hypothetical protein
MQPDNINYFIGLTFNLDTNPISKRISTLNEVLNFPCFHMRTISADQTDHLPWIYTKTGWNVKFSCIFTVPPSFVCDFLVMLIIYYIQL